MKILPCPFCKSKKVEILFPQMCPDSTPLHALFWVQCECSATGPIKDTQRKAINAWNKVKREN